MGGAVLGAIARELIEARLTVEPAVWSIVTAKVTEHCDGVRGAPGRASTQESQRGASGTRTKTWANAAGGGRSAGGQAGRSGVQGSAAGAGAGASEAPGKAAAVRAKIRKIEAAHAAQAAAKEDTKPWERTIELYGVKGDGESTAVAARRLCARYGAVERVTCGYGDEGRIRVQVRFRGLVGAQRAAKELGRRTARPWAPKRDQAVRLRVVARKVRAVGVDDVKEALREIGGSECRAWFHRRDQVMIVSDSGACSRLRAAIGDGVNLPRGLGRLVQVAGRPAAAAGSAPAGDGKTTDAGGADAGEEDDDAPEEGAEAGAAAQGRDDGPEVDNDDGSVEEDDDASEGDMTSGEEGEPEDAGDGTEDRTGDDVEAKRDEGERALPRRSKRVTNTSRAPGGATAAGEQ